MENSAKSKLAIGLLLGVAAGAAVYYLMTNPNGKRQLANAVDAVKDFGTKAKEMAINQSGKLANSASEASSQLISKTQDLTSKLANEVKAKVEQIS